MLHFFWSRYNLSEKSYSNYEYSNSEIAKWAEYYLSKKTGFHQSSWEAGKVTENPNDILIGHPTWFLNSNVVNPIFGEILRNWVKDNAIDSNQLSHPNTYILMPWLSEWPTDWLTSMPFLESQLLQAQKIFAICVQIWIDRTFARQDDSIQFRVKDKLIRCNLGLTSQNFPFYKKSFNKIGDRQILHVSNLAAWKGFDVLCKSLIGLDTLLYVASKEKLSVGMTRVEFNEEEFFFSYMGEINNNDPRINAWIVQNCDFYIHTSRLDAQATTILENCARGLIPLITPESGFSSPHAIYLTHDPVENRKIIEWALNLPEEDLINRSNLLREQIYREHNWSDIFDQILNEIAKDIENRNLLSANS